MKLEPRDSFFEEGNQIFKDLKGKVLSQFVCYETSSNKFLYVVFTIESSSIKYRIFLDAGLAFWDESEDFENEDDTIMNEIVSLEKKIINEIYWMPDENNSKIVIQLNECEIIIRCKDSKVFDSEVDLIIE